jgi:hypothetical protein
LRATIGSLGPGSRPRLFVLTAQAALCGQCGWRLGKESDYYQPAGFWAIGRSFRFRQHHVRLVDVFINPAFGSAGVTDTNALRPASHMDSSWLGDGDAAPAVGRVMANVKFQCDTGVLAASDVM